MAKPICVVKVDIRHNGFVEIYKIQQLLDDRFNDYHVLVVPFQQPEDEYDEPMQLQVFHEKDFTEVQYQELKQMIQDELKALKNNTKQQ